MESFYPLWLIEYNGRKQLRVSDERISEKFLETEMKKVPDYADIWFNPLGADIIVKY